MKPNEKIRRTFNAFLKHTKGKCPIIAYTQPLVPAVKCILEHKLASGIGYYTGHEGTEIGAWFTRSWKRQVPPGPGGVKYQGYPDWEEVDPPGKPIAMEAPAGYLSCLPPESIDLIQQENLFFFTFVYETPEDRMREFQELFGERLIPGIIMESDAFIYPYVRQCHDRNPVSNREEAYKMALERIREIKEEKSLGIAGSGVTWYQGAKITKQKRWDHEIANGSFQVQSCFLRGVSRQHDIPFITYVAPMGNTREGLWGTKVDPDTPFRKFFNCTYASGGKPDHLLERQWYYAWFSGSAAVIMEASEFYLFKEGRDKKTFTPGCMAPAMQRLNHLAWESDFDRGNPYRPACILLDEAHGWNFPCGHDGHNYDPPYHLARKVWGVFDYGHQDHMVDNFFGAVYPGYEYGGSWGGELGDLVQSPYGESFDVLMSNAGSKALAGYPVTFVLGKPKLTAGYKKKLEEYVKAGGNLVMNISQVDYEWGDFLGVRFAPKYNRWYVGLGTLRASDFSEWLKPHITWKENRYHYSRLRATKGEVLARTEQGDPLVVRNKVGKGCVYLVTAHFMQEISGFHPFNGLLEVSKFLIGHVLEPYQKLKVRGGELSYMVNETEDGLAVLLSNNGKTRWSGWITFPDMKRAKVEEWYACERIHAHRAGNDLSVRLSIPAYSVRVLSVKRVKKQQRGEKKR